jgi:hypothetical protein
MPGNPSNASAHNTRWSPAPPASTSRTYSVLCRRRHHADCADIGIVPTSSVNCLPGMRIRVCRSAQSWPVAELQEGVGWQVAAGRSAEDVHGASDRPRVEFAYVRGDPRHRADRRALRPARDIRSSIFGAGGAGASPDRQIVPTFDRECPYVTGDRVPGRHNHKVGTIGDTGQRAKQQQPRSLTLRDSHQPWPHSVTGRLLVVEARLSTVDSLSMVSHS